MNYIGKYLLCTRDYEAKYDKLATKWFKKDTIYYIEDWDDRKNIIYLKTIPYLVENNGNLEITDQVSVSGYIEGYISVNSIDSFGILYDSHLDAEKACESLQDQHPTPRFQSTHTNLAKAKEVNEKTSTFIPVYAIGTYVEFDTGKVSYTYRVGHYYMSCSSGWDAIYKELSVNPESFIRKATGKDAKKYYTIYSTNNFNSTGGYNMQSSDKLINALLKACADRRGTARFIDSRSGNHVSPLTDPVPSFNDVLNKLKVDQLEVS